MKHKKNILTLPIASKPLSNSNRTHKNKKATPMPANPTPISVLEKDKIIIN